MNLQNKKLAKIVHYPKLHLEHFLRIYYMLTRVGCGGEGGGGGQRIKVLRSRVYPFGHLATIKVVRSIMFEAQKTNWIFSYVCLFSNELTFK